jgi:hypothetical protein
MSFVGDSRHPGDFSFRGMVSIPIFVMKTLHMNASALHTDISQMLERLKSVHYLQLTAISNPPDNEQLTKILQEGFACVYGKKFAAQRFALSVEMLSYFSSFKGMLSSNSFTLLGAVTMPDNAVAADGSLWLRIALRPDLCEYFLCCDKQHPMYGCIIEAGTDQKLPSPDVRPDSPERTERIWIGILDFLYDNAGMYRNWQEEELRVMDRKGTETHQHFSFTAN